MDIILMGSPTITGFIGEREFGNEKANWEDKLGNYMGLYAVETALRLQPACSIWRIAMRFFFDDKIIEETPFGVAVPQHAAEKAKETPGKGRGSK